MNAASGILSGSVLFLVTLISAVHCPPGRADDQVGAGKFDLKYVPKNVTFVIAIRPARCAVHPSLKPLVPDVNEFLIGPKTGLRVTDIDQAMVIGLRVPGEGSSMEDETVVLLKTRNDFDFTKSSRARPRTSEREIDK